MASPMASPRVNTYWAAITSGSVSSDQVTGTPHQRATASRIGRLRRKLARVAVTLTTGSTWGAKATRLIRLPPSTIELVPESIAEENQIHGSRPAKTNTG